MKTKQMYQSFEKHVTPILKKLEKKCQDNKQAIDEIREIPTNVTKCYNIELRDGDYSASRIVGLLSSDDKPETAIFQTRDWETEWQAADGQNEELLLQFARQFDYSW